MSKDKGRNKEACTIVRKVAEQKMGLYSWGLPIPEGTLCISGAHSPPLQNDCECWIWDVIRVFIVAPNGWER